MSPHGTYVRYVAEKCRCPECRAANTRYAHDLAIRTATGRSYFVDAEPIRERWRALRALGMCNEEIERAAGVSHHTSHNLFRAHQRTGKPVKRMKRETAAKVMAVSRRAMKAGQRVSVPEFREMTLDLMALGYSGAWIAARLGRSYQGRAALLRSTVRAETYAAMRALHGSTCAPASESAASTRSRNFATSMRKRTRHLDRERIALMLDEGRPAHEIAETAGCAVRTIERVKVERRQAVAV